MDSLVSAIDDRRRLELRFDRQNDRHSHAVFLVEDEQERCILRTSEGDGQAIWPPSPPLQQLSIEERSAGSVALLVGMAGRSHWSLSVETIAGGEFHFDAACRIARDDSQPDDSLWLGSTYQCLEPHVIELAPVEGLLVSEEPNIFQAIPRSTAGPQSRWTYVIRAAS